MVKNVSANAGDSRDADLIPGSGRSPRVGNGNPLQYSCLGYPIGRGAWWATVDGVAKELNFSIFEITLHSGNKSYLVILYFIKSGKIAFANIYNFVSVLISDIELQFSLFVLS